MRKNKGTTLKSSKKTDEDEDIEEDVDREEWSLISRRVNNFK